MCRVQGVEFLVQFDGERTTGKKIGAYKSVVSA